MEDWLRQFIKKETFVAEIITTTHQNLILLAKIIAFLEKGQVEVDLNIEDEYFFDFEEYKVFSLQYGRKLTLRRGNDRLTIVALPEYGPSLLRIDTLLGAMYNTQNVKRSHDFLRGLGIPSED